MRHCSIVHEDRLGNYSRRSLSGTPFAETRDLWSAVTINATAQGDFDGLAALRRNRIFELRGAEPDFLMEFKTKLGQRFWIEADTVCFF
jgi:hypothetical protein